MACTVKRICKPLHVSLYRLVYSKLQFFRVIPDASFNNRLWE